MEVRDFVSNFLEKNKNNPSLLISEFSVRLKNLKNEKEITPDEFQKIPKGEGVDVWLKKDGVEYLIDLKTTQINAGGGTKFTRNFLNWNAYRLLFKPACKVECRLAFPFNPHKSRDFWTKEAGKVQPLVPSIKGGGSK